MNPEDGQETLPNLNTILEAINGLRLEMNERFNNAEARLVNLENRVINVENDVRQVKEMQFVFENELDRLQAIVHQSLNPAHENRADVRIMRKEIAAWSQDVRNIQRQAV
jgi:hypothetical protein